MFLPGPAKKECPHTTHIRQVHIFGLPPFLPPPPNWQWWLLQPFQLFSFIFISWMIVAKYSCLRKKVITKIIPFPLVPPQTTHASTQSWQMVFCFGFASFFFYRTQAKAWNAVLPVTLAPRNNSWNEDPVRRSSEHQEEHIPVTCFVSWFALTMSPKVRRKKAA